MKRLAIVATHPIQYNVPWFRRLAVQEGIEVCVFYTWHADEKAKYDPHFDREIAWDIPLLNGYDYQLVAPRPTVKQKTFWNLNSDITGPIKAWGADAILVLGWNYRSHLRAMRYFSGRIPVYFRGDSTLLDTQNGIRRRLRKIFLRYVYSCVDTAFFVGINNYDYFQKYGLKQTQLTFAPHAIDNNRFSSDAMTHETEASQWRTSLGIPADSVVFLFVGKLIQKKSPEILLRAFQKLPHKNKQHLIFVGDGECEADLKKLASDAINVHFVQFQNQSRMPVVYRLGDVMCLPSAGPGETWGLAVNEAMASGRTVIVSDKVGCARDLVADESIGHIHKANSVESLYVAMQKCCERNRLLLKGTHCGRFIDRWSCEQLAANIGNKLRSAA